MEITGLGWCGTRTGRGSELAHFYEHVLGTLNERTQRQMSASGWGYACMLQLSRHEYAVLTVLQSSGLH
jgi:hypothetical protein